MSKKIVLDLTVCTFNRTAVYDIGFEIAEVAKDFDVTFKYGPLRWKSWIEFRDNKFASFLGKVFWRLSSYAPKGLRDRLLGQTRKASSRHATIYVEPLFAENSDLCARDVMIIHDLGYITHPEHADNAEATDAYDRAYKKIRTAGCSMVFVSAATRDAFAETYPGHEGLQRVVHNFNPFVLMPDVRPPHLSQDGKYFLAVGVMGRRKNYLRLIQAFEQSALVEQGYQLKICGPGGNQNEEVLNLIEATPGVVHTGFVSREQLVELYQNATALAFPSLLEGFGLPAIEAPMLGTLPVLSDLSIFQEVAGDSAIYCNPEQIEDIARALFYAASLTADEKSERLNNILDHQKMFDLAIFKAAWRDILQDMTDDAGDAPG